MPRNIHEKCTTRQKGPGGMIKGEFWKTKRTEKKIYSPGKSQKFANGRRWNFVEIETLGQSVFRTYAREWKRFTESWNVLKNSERHDVKLMFVSNKQQRMCVRCVIYPAFFFFFGLWKRDKSIWNSSRIFRNVFVRSFSYFCIVYFFIAMHFVIHFYASNSVGNVEFQWSWIIKRRKESLEYYYKFSRHS